VPWPEGKRFAFSVFDDPDYQTTEGLCAVYGLLRDLGFRTTIGVWPVAPVRKPSVKGATCDDPDYLACCLDLRHAGFEVGLHNVTPHTSTRAETRAGLDEFVRKFGAHPSNLAQHHRNEEALYWGELRLTGTARVLYNVLTRARNKGWFRGERKGDPHFWGDLCRERIRYVRNFTFSEVNTLRSCPFSPYHDPARPYVNYWYCSSEGTNAETFLDTLREENQDKLEEEGGLCIMYAHFGDGFWENKQLNGRFRQLMERLARKNGWFVPVSNILDFLRERNRNHIITDTERAALERRWLIDKIRHGTT
jgi:hypothetical protein